MRVSLLDDAEYSVDMYQGLSELYTKHQLNDAADLDRVAKCFVALGRPSSRTNNIFERFQEPDQVQICENPSDNVENFDWVAERVSTPRRFLVELSR